MAGWDEEALRRLRALLDALMKRLRMTRADFESAVQDALERWRKGQTVTLAIASVGLVGTTTGQTTVVEKSAHDSATLIESTDVTVTPAPMPVVEMVAILVIVSLGPFTVWCAARATGVELDAWLVQALIDAWAMYIAGVITSILKH